MNTLDILTYWRSRKGFREESDISTPEFMRLINLAYHFVGQLLYPIFTEDLVYELAAGLHLSTTTLYAPDDSLNIIDIYRETVASSGIYKRCHKVETENKHLIGESQDFPIRAEYPLYIREGKKITVFPSFPSVTGVNIKILYRRRLADLIMGAVTITTTSDTIALDVLASIRNDIYNGYDMAIFKRNSSQDNAWELEKILKVEDYVGSIRVCSFRGTAGNDEFAATTTYRYALYPFFPEQFHNYILDAIKIELIKAGRMDGDPTVQEASLVKRIALSVQATGVTQETGGQS